MRAPVLQFSWQTVHRTKVLIRLVLLLNLLGQVLEVLVYSHGFLCPDYHLLYYIDDVLSFPYF